MAIVATPKRAIDHIGEIGLYQFQVFALSCLPSFVAGCVNNMLYYISYTPPYRCFVPECDIHSNSSSVSKEPFFGFVFPEKNHDSRSLHQFSHCEMYKPIHSMAKSSHILNQSIAGLKQEKCAAKYFHTNYTVHCKSFIYDESSLKSTMVTTFDLVCNKEHFVSIMQTIFILGMLTASISIGCILNRFGHKVIFIVTSLVQIISLLLLYMVNSFVLVCLLLFLIAFSNVFAYQSALVIGIELFAEKYRFLFRNFYSLVFLMGALATCFLECFSKDWRPIIFFLLFPAVFTLLYPLIFPESIWWYISRKRLENALNEIKKATVVNKIAFKEKSILKEIKSDFKKLKNSSNSNLSNLAKSFHFLFISSRKMCKCTLLLIILWIANVFVYYAIFFLASDLGLNFNLSLALIIVIEIPAMALTILVSKFEHYRKTILMVEFLFAGLNFALAGVIDPSNVLKPVTALIGKLFVSSSFTLLRLYTDELLPKYAKNFGLGLCSVFAQLTIILTPHIRKFVYIKRSLPFSVLGGISVAASILTGLLHKVDEKSLNDRIQESFEIDELSHSKSSSLEYSATQSSMNQKTKNHRNSKVYII